MKLALAAAILVLSISGVAGCGNGGGDEGQNSDQSPSTAADEPTGLSLDEQAEVLESEGLNVTNAYPGSGEVGYQDSFVVDGGKLGNSVLITRYWSDVQAASKARDRYSHMLRELEQGTVTDLSSDGHTVYYLLDPQDIPAQGHVDEFQRLVDEIGGEEPASTTSNEPTTSTTESKPLDTQVETLEAEGLGISSEDAGGSSQDGFTGTGGEIGDALFVADYWDDPNVAQTEFDAISQVYTGNLAKRGRTALSGDRHVVYQVVREGKPLTADQIAEFERLVDLLESGS